MERIGACLMPGADLQLAVDLAQKTGKQAKSLS